MSKLTKVTYSLDDVGIVQSSVSYCEHRKDVNPFIKVCGRDMYPIFASPMESVIDENNYRIFIDNKITPVIPRTVQMRLSLDERLKLSSETFVSFSLKEAEELLAANAFGDLGFVSYICIDMAHGTLRSLYKVCRDIKDMYGDNVIIMTGNVNNAEAYYYYCDAGIDYMRLTIGSGSRCVVEGTKVKMADGSSIGIEEIDKGDYVMTLNGANKVLNTFTKYTETTYKINNDIKIAKTIKLPQN